MLKKLLLLLTLSTNALAEAPDLAIVFVIDQFAHHVLKKLEPHLNDGLKKLVDNGIVYTKAYYPHAQPGTAAGHACLNTGVLPKIHGIISNYWYDESGKKINCYDDKDSPVLASEGIYEYGKSPKNLMVTGFSKEFVEQSPKNKFFAISLKNRAATGLAGKYGKAIWLDRYTGGFTSSKAYFDKQPNWLKQFNKKNKLTNNPEIRWKLAYPSDSNAYKFEDIRNYEFASAGIAETTIPTLSGDKKTINKAIKRTPQTNLVLLNCAKKCLEKNLTKKNSKFVLCISMSGFDKAGHYHGPNSLEAIDLIYHFDKQIGEFMRAVEKKYPNKKIMYVLTADHGVLPIPELLARKGIKAKRVYTKPLQEKMNVIINEKFNIENIVIAFNNPYFYLNIEKLDALDKGVQDSILSTLKEFLLKQDGIKNVWTYDELKNASFPAGATEILFQNQLFPGRSGQLIVHGPPKTLITMWPTGTGHVTPYEEDRHVPLVIYQKDVLEKKKIDKEITMTQFAPTMASIFNTAKPAASTYQPLPLA